MREGDLMMSRKERERKSVFDRVNREELLLSEAAEILGLSYRQCKRVYGRYRREGDTGLVHCSRGRSSNRGCAPEVRSRAMEYYRERLEGFGPTLAAEKLYETGIEVDHETLRRWLIGERLWRLQRKRRAHRTRREPRAHFGELVQMDGSPHRWFGEERDEHCLMDMVDDATGTTLSWMAKEETTDLALQTLWLWVERYGIPRALYTDKKTVFVTDRFPTVQEQLAGEEPLTAFGKVCKKLGIEIITANSPQAKGRVERKHGVYQDRFLKELRFRGVTTVDEANALLRGGFCDLLNVKFAREPKNKADYHREVPRAMELAEVFVREELRRVANDWTLSFNGRIYQIGPENRLLPKPKDHVIVRTRLDGQLRLVYRGHPLQFALAPLPVPRQASKPKRVEATPKPKTKTKPRPTHPWKNNCILMAADPQKPAHKPGRPASTSTR